MEKNLTVGKVYDFINEVSPFELQEKWDNSGIIVGNKSNKVNKVYLSLDLDLNIVEDFEENSLVVTHHPLIFSALKTINFDSYSTMILKRLIEKNISLISVHTNFDKTHLNNYFTKEILGLEVQSTYEFINYVDIKETKFDDVYNEVLEKLNIKSTNKVKCHDTIKKIAIVTGSGTSLIPEIDADCFLTGDIGYHHAMEAKARGISLIDIKHYDSEKCFNLIMNDLISEKLSSFGVDTILKDSMNPFD